MKPTSSKIFWQTFITATVLMSGLAIYQTVQRVADLEITLWRSKWILLVGLFALNIFAGMFVLWQLSNDRASYLTEKQAAVTKSGINPWVGSVLIAFGFFLVWAVRLFFFGDVLPQIAPIFWVFLWASLIQTFGLQLLTGRDWLTPFVAAVLVQGVVYQIFGHLTIVSAYPFSIGYSEAGRHYYASLFFARPLYGTELALPFLHPTRYFLMSLPFLVDGLPLWAHRLWQALLWIGLTAASSILLIRRLNFTGWVRFALIAWAFLYFFQGAVYYHLQVCVILILAGVSVKHPWRSLLFVVLASVWAGASRVNWFPVPAMLAVAIYLLETPLEGKGWRYWLTPFLWGICGLAAASASQFAYIAVSGNSDARSFGSSFTSDLIWSRLLPNETFPMGILLGIVIVSAPLIFAFIQMVRGKISSLHPLRWLALIAMLAVLFLGGMVVSVKIGGGADLHNMDAFLVMLALVVTAFIGGRVAGEREANPAWGAIPVWVVAAAALVPIGFALPQVGFFQRYDSNLVEADLFKLQASTQNIEGEILFVTERQLLIFNDVNNIPLVPEYEQMELMEMAMSGNRDYLENFYADLRSHRFALIVAEEQKFALQKHGAFLEENNAWVRFVGAPILCAYKPVTTLSSTNIQVFAPRENNPECKDPFEK
ncbi:MAG TPA: hypothetical protein PKE43_14785 [Anaerolineales bacterium]|nr:hypothetical protein [Anaerolineales bacterium]